jgi:hypothetical protein
MSLGACALVPFGVKSLVQRAVKRPSYCAFDSRGTPIWNIPQSEAARSWTKSTSLCRGRLVLGSSSSQVSRACNFSTYSTRCARISSKDGKNTRKSILISCRARRPNGNRAAPQKPLAQKLSCKQRTHAGLPRVSRYAIESARACRVETQIRVFGSRAQGRSATQFGLSLLAVARKTATVFSPSTASIRSTTRQLWFSNA